MNRIITAYCAGETIKKSGPLAGAAGSHNAVTLRFTFSPEWDGTTKKVCFIDSHGEKPVYRNCTIDKLTPGTTDSYDIPIPGEGTKYEGKMTVTVRGVELAKDGLTAERIMMSVSTTLDVDPAEMPSTATEPIEPTPTQTEQLQSEIDGIKAEISGSAQAVIDAQAAQVAAESARDSANTAKNEAQTARAAAETAEAHAKTSETNAATHESGAQTAKTGAESAKDAAELAKSAAQTAQAAAETARTAAETAQGLAETAKTAAETAKTDAISAKDAAVTAKNASVSAQGLAETARDAAIGAKNAALAAQTAAETAANNAQNSAEDSEAWADGTINGVAVPSTHPAYHNNSKYYKEQAAAIVGGDYPTKSEAQGYATTAKNDAITAAATDATAKANAAAAASVSKSLATAASQFLVSSAVGVWAVKTIAEIKALLGLGSAAYTASTDYATSAQGTKADGAIAKSLGTAADQLLVSTGAGTWAVKTLAQIKTWLGLGSAAYTDSTAYAVAVHKSRHATGGADALTPGDIGAAKRLSKTATLAIANWTGSAAPYTYELTDADILAADTPHVDRVTGTDAAAAALINTAWGLIAGYAVKPQTSAGKITFYASAKPSVALPIMYEVVRS